MSAVLVSFALLVAQAPAELPLQASAQSTPDLLEGFRVTREHLRFTPPVELSAGAALVTERFEGRAREALVSWNLDVPTGSAAIIETRLAPWSAPGRPSEWLFLGYAGSAPSTKGGQQADWLRVDTDFVRCDEPCAWIEVRVQHTRGAPVRVERIDVSLRDRQRSSAVAAPPSPGWPIPALEVPFRAQRFETGALGSRLCSPTSCSMVLGFHGASVPTLDFAARAHDALHDLYGNWPRNVQAARELGIQGYLTAIAHWSEAEALLARGLPLVISIAAREGELRGAPYRKTGGHLLVLKGIDANGDALVNDPAAREQGSFTYRREDLTRCWLGRGGTTYVFLGMRER